MNKKQRLTMSSNDKMLFGVCGGVAEYFNQDATLIRIAWVILILLTGFLPGVLAYIVLAIITPEKDEVENNG